MHYHDLFHFDLFLLGSLGLLSYLLFQERTSVIDCRLKFRMPVVVHPDCRSISTDIHIGDIFFSYIFSLPIEGRKWLQCIVLVLVLQNVDCHHAFSLSSIGYLGITLPVLATGSTVLALLSVTQHYPALVRIIQHLSALFSRSGIFQRFDPFVHLRASIHFAAGAPIRY